MSKRQPRESLKIDRPFAIFVEPAHDVPGAWVAHVVGHELDNVTQGEGPEDAVYMIYDLLKGMTDYCSRDNPEHDYSVETTFRAWCGPGDEDYEQVPCWGCSRCDTKVAKTEFADDGQG